MRQSFLEINSVFRISFFFTFNCLASFKAFNLPCSYRTISEPCYLQFWIKKYYFNSIFQFHLLSFIFIFVVRCVVSRTCLAIVFDDLYCWSDTRSCCHLFSLLPWLTKAPLIQFQFLSLLLCTYSLNWK